MILAFGGAGVFLLVGGGRDRRAQYLGAAYLVAAAPFCDRPLVDLGRLSPNLAASVGALAHLRVSAFLPCFLWSFAERFPRLEAFGFERTLLRGGKWASLILGSVLFLANVVNAVAIDSGVTLSASLDRGRETGLYWLIICSLSVPPLVLAFYRTRFATPLERRRVRVFGAGLAIGAMPLFANVLLATLIPATREFLFGSRFLGVNGALVYVGLVSIPMVTSYSIVVHHVLDVRLVLRKAIQYALARYTLLVATATPFAWLAFHLYARRNETLAELMSGPDAWISLGAGALGMAALNGRRKVMDRIDRRFFRTHYDARRILADLIERQRDARTLVDWVAVLRRELDRALQLESVYALLRQPGAVRLTEPSGAVRALELDGPICRHAREVRQPVEVNLDLPDATHRWPLADRLWLADVGARVLVPLVHSDSRLLGLLALGEKRSELPFTREDMIMLATIASSASLSLENRWMRSSAGLGRRPESEASTLDGPSGDPMALPALDPGALGEHCLNCMRVQPAGNEPRCTSCGADAAPSGLPHVIAGKFRLQEVIGWGGMGIVYRAVDTELARNVAIKTLPALSARQAVRLRQEARAMASVSHPHLALIFGAESWMGRPLLICEYLEGKTLAFRLDQAPLSIEETLALGLALADAVAALHRAGILHRDIKPSNIGYTRDRAPKLLDFGLARMLMDTGSRETDTTEEPGHDGRSSSPAARPVMPVESSWARSVPKGEASVTTLTREGQLVGTPMYLSPEAARGDPPDRSVDVWSLSVVLYESLTCLNPFFGRTVDESLFKISCAQVPDVRDSRSDCPGGLAKLLSDCLSLDRTRRPASAPELAARLQNLGRS